MRKLDNIDFRFGGRWIAFCYSALNISHNTLKTYLGQFILAHIRINLILLLQFFDKTCIEYNFVSDKNIVTIMYYEHIIRSISKQKFSLIACLCLSGNAFPVMDFSTSGIPQMTYLLGFLPRRHDQRANDVATELKCSMESPIDPPSHSAQGSPTVWLFYFGYAELSSATYIFTYICQKWRTLGYIFLQVAYHNRRDSNLDCMNREPTTFHWAIELKEIAK